MERIAVAEIIDRLESQSGLNLTPQTIRGFEAVAHPDGTVDVQEGPDGQLMVVGKP